MQSLPAEPEGPSSDDSDDGEGEGEGEGEGDDGRAQRVAARRVAAETKVVRPRPVAARPPPAAPRAVEVDADGIPLYGRGGELLSEYERQRLLTIRQNELKLAALMGSE